MNVSLSPDLIASLNPRLIVTLMLAGILLLYFLPALVAGRRGHPQATAIFVLNLLLGFTVLGWVGALVWACMNCQPAWPAEACAFTEQAPCDDPSTDAYAAPSRRHGRVPAALSPGQRRMLVEVEHNF
jgi:hypothetical protein